MLADDGTLAKISTQMGKYKRKRVKNWRWDLCSWEEAERRVVSVLREVPFAAGRSAGTEGAFWNLRGEQSNPIRGWSRPAQKASATAWTPSLRYSSLGGGEAKRRLRLHPEVGTREKTGIGCVETAWGPLWCLPGQPRNTGEAWAHWGGRVTMAGRCARRGQTPIAAFLHVHSGGRYHSQSSKSRLGANCCHLRLQRRAWTPVDTTTPPLFSCLPCLPGECAQATPLHTLYQGITASKHLTGEMASKSNQKLPLTPKTY